ncbi:hypothetical protein YC2023_052647 [Brassica napus]
MPLPSLLLHSFSPDQARGGIIVSYSEGPSRPLLHFPPKPLQEEFNKDNNNLGFEQLPSCWEAMDQLLHGVRTVTFSGEAMNQPIACVLLQEEATIKISKYLELFVAEVGHS